MRRQKSADDTVCAGQRPDQVGRSPAGTRISSAISESEGDSSLAGVRCYLASASDVEDVQRRPVRTLQALRSGVVAQLWSWPSIVLQ